MGAQLYRSGKYLDSLRLIYPSIEAIFNTMLIEIGKVPQDFNGLTAKAQHLGRRGKIPPDIANAMEVFTARNIVVHGNFSPPKDHAQLLCVHIFLYLRRLLTEYHSTN